MLELEKQTIEKSDIEAPALNPGESAIVFQRHEKYERDRNSETAGSLIPEQAEEAFGRDLEFFKKLLDDDANGQTMILFISSDTQYAGKGHRSMETAQIAQDAAVRVLQEKGIDPDDRIINFNSDFSVNGFESSGQLIRPDSKIAEPQIFDEPEYVDFLREKYGEEDGAGSGISTEAWAAHERDAYKEVREGFGAEGVYDVLARTKKSLAILERYARLFHAKNPNKKLLIWAASHYDTISPLVKDAAKIGFDEHMPVDYGAGVVIKLSKNQKPYFEALGGSKIELELGSKAVTSSQ